MDNKKSTTAFDKELGRKIHFGRRMRDLSMVELSEKLEISHQQLQKYEAGHNRVPVQRLVRISQVLRLPVTYFLKDDRFDPRMTGEILKTAGLIQDLPSNDLRRDIKKLVRTITTVVPDNQATP